MENSTKKTMSILSAIGSIVLGAIEFISSLKSISIYNELELQGYDVGGYVILSGMDLIMSVLLIVFAAVSLSQRYRYNKGLSITVLVFLSIILLAQIVVMVAAFNSLQILGLLLVLFAFSTKIAEMTLKNYSVASQDVRYDNGNYGTQNVNRFQNQAPQTAGKTQMVDDKIKELKHLKDLGVIDEEQYNKAINKILEDLK